MSREESLALIDRALEHGPFESRVPAELEASAKKLFEDESRGLTGNIWDWKAASEEVRNRYRLKVLVPELR